MCVWQRTCACVCKRCMAGGQVGRRAGGVVCKRKRGTTATLQARGPMRCGPALQARSRRRLTRALGACVPGGCGFTRRVCSDRTLSRACTSRPGSSPSPWQRPGAYCECAQQAASPAAFCVGSGPSCVTPYPALMLAPLLTMRTRQHCSLASALFSVLCAQSSTPPLVAAALALCPIIVVSLRQASSNQYTWWNSGSSVASLLTRNPPRCASTMQSCGRRYDGGIEPWQTGACCPHPWHAAAMFPCCCTDDY